MKKRSPLSCFNINEDIQCLDTVLFPRYTEYYLFIFICNSMKDIEHNKGTVHSKMNIYSLLWEFFFLS